MLPVRGQLGRCKVLSVRIHPYKLATCAGGICHDAHVRRPARNWMLAGLSAAVVTLVGVVVANGVSTRAGAQPPRRTVSVTVGAQPSSRPLPPAFVGLSLEYTAIAPYTGDDPRAINPVLLQLIRNLSASESPVLRIGGNSSDESWWPQRGELAPRHARFALRQRWLSTVRALAVATGARLIMGLNLAGGRPEAATIEAQAFLRGIGRPYIEAMEIGNEPDLYGLFVWYNDHGRSVYRRPGSYSLSDFIGQFSRWRAAIGRRLPVAGPAYATFDWSLGSFIAAEPGLTSVTLHHYPLDACLTKPQAIGYATISNLLSDRASSGFAKQIAPEVAVAHARHVPFRLDELGSASCGGKWGVSNTFASALWMLDTLFDLASVGVDGVNVHTFPGAAYAPFAFKHTAHGWTAFVDPEYYGMLLFTQAFPSGARLLPAHASPIATVTAWATRGPGSATRVVLINKDPDHGYQVKVRIHGVRTRGQIERLQAPGVNSTGPVTLGGQTFGAQTTTGRLRGAPQKATASPGGDGAYTITLPAASAVLLTVSTSTGMQVARWL